MKPTHKALAALLRAQLQQRDYLTPKDIKALKDALRSLARKS